MTQIDDAAAKATAYMKATENIALAYRALSSEHRAKLLNDFPTLNTALAMFVIHFNSLGGS